MQLFCFLILLSLKPSLLHMRPTSCPNNLPFFLPLFQLVTPQFHIPVFDLPSIALDDMLVRMYAAAFNQYPRHFTILRFSSPKWPVLVPQSPPVALICSRHGSQKVVALSMSLNLDLSSPFSFLRTFRLPLFGFNPFDSSKTERM